jgi:hypothetical protein
VYIIADQNIEKAKRLRSLLQVKIHSPLRLCCNLVCLYTYGLRPLILYLSCMYAYMIDVCIR